MDGIQLHVIQSTRMRESDPQTESGRNRGRTLQNGRMNTPEFDMMGFGEVLLRLTPLGRGRILGAEHFDREIGGAELNVAAGLAMLGLRTR